MAGTMRGVYTNLTDIRRRVFTEVAKVAYGSAKDLATTEDPVPEAVHELRQLPYKLIPGNVATYRESVFLERAIVQERIRLAMGLPLQDLDRPETVSDGIKKAQRLPGLPGAPLPRDLPQGRHLVQGQEGVHRPRQVHQVRPLRQRVPLPRHSPPRAPLRRRVRHARDWL